MSNFAIGDVQGCFDELQTLLQLIHFNPARDYLWFTGDLVNRGPKSLEVLRFVKALGEHAIVVLGNHDLHLLAVNCNPENLNKNDTLDDILQAPDREELCNWLRQRPLLYHDVNLGYTMVHAGIPPQWDLNAALEHAHEVETVLQSPDYGNFFPHMYGDEPSRWDDHLSGWPRLRMISNYLTRMRFCDATGTLELHTKGTPAAPPPGLMPWFKIPTRANRSLKIIFGHWAALAGQTEEPGVYALDTGCAWGHHLSAMRLEDEAWFSVPCAQSQILPNK